MAWKCDKCGMPNFGDEACKLCGTPKPENPEEFREEPERESDVFGEPEVSTVPETEVVPEPEVTAEPETEVVPEPEVTAEPEAEVVPEPEVTAEPEAEVVPEPEVTAEPEAEVVPEPEVTAEPETEATHSEEQPVLEDTAQVADTPLVKEEESVPGKSKKTGIIIAIICLLLLAAICAAGIYLYGVKDTLGIEELTSPSPSPQVTAPANIDNSVFPSSEAPEIVPSEVPEDVHQVESLEPQNSAVPTESAISTPVATKKPAVASKPVATPKPAKTAKPITTPKPLAVSTPQPWDDNYRKYVNNDFGFYCAYPVNFKVLEENTNDALLTAISSDETAHMMIQGSKNWDKLSVQDALNRYINMIGGEIQYQASGNTWYAASIRVGDRVYYRKAYVRENSIYCFSFEYNYEDRKIYSPYIEYIEDHFKRN